MADRMIRANYQNMIDALTTFATRTYTVSSEMQTSANVCRTALGDGDDAIQAIYKQIQDAQLKYAELAQTARNIANAMQRELDTAGQEQKVWSED